MSIACLIIGYTLGMITVLIIHERDEAERRANALCPWRHNQEHKR